MPRAGGRGTPAGPRWRRSLTERVSWSAFPLRGADRPKGVAMGEIEVLHVPAVLGLEPLVLDFGDELGVLGREPEVGRLGMPARDDAVLDDLGALAVRLVGAVVLR